MKTTLALLFAIALMFTVAPGAFADDVQPVQDQQIEAAQADIAEAPMASVDADVLQVLDLNPMFAGTDKEAVCHWIPCQQSGCPYQYPTCMSNGCCC